MHWRYYSLVLSHGYIFCRSGAWMTTSSTRIRMVLTAILTWTTLTTTPRDTLVRKNLLRNNARLTSTEIFNVEKWERKWKNCASDASYHLHWLTVFIFFMCRFYIYIYKKWICVCMFCNYSALVVNIHSQRWQKCACICWWHGDIRSQSISRHGLDQICMK